MMIQIQLLSFPKIEEGGVLIRFPYKKAEALFYYLAVEKSISRDKAALLLWEDEDELTAKKNLRHAIYIIRKMFHDEVVISPQKSMLQLNPSAAVSTDLESLDGSADGSLPAYDEFLKDFSVKNAENYTQWLEEKRALYSGRYLNAIYQHMQSDALETEQAEELFERYTALDAFDERIYMALMGIYQKKELFHKGVQLYQKLQRLLEEEFGIAPSKAASECCTGNAPQRSAEPTAHCLCCYAERSHHRRTRRRKELSGTAISDGDPTGYYAGACSNLFSRRKKYAAPIVERHHLSNR